MSTWVHKYMSTWYISTWVPEYTCVYMYYQRASSHTSSYVPRTHLVYTVRRRRILQCPCTLSRTPEGGRRRSPRWRREISGGENKWRVWSSPKLCVSVTARLIAQRDVTIIGKVRPSTSTSTSTLTMSTVEFPVLKPISSDRLWVFHRYSLILGLDNNCADDIRLVIQAVHLRMVHYTVHCIL